ncbi:MAG TPA: hypothetical protein PKM51_02795 [Chitinophagales bacterium]|nr:hypothetical protein [Chitinophagales bacterium]HNM31654.1 hypothetical protein [Chitinophagales bacterium]
MATSKKTTKEPLRLLTAHDLAFGIGRKFTDEEITLLIKEHENDTFVSEEEVSKSIEKEIAKIYKKKAVVRDRV